MILFQPGEDLHLGRFADSPTSPVAITGSIIEGHCHVKDRLFHHVFGYWVLVPSTIYMNRDGVA